MKDDYKQLNPASVQEMARQLVNLLRRNFQERGNVGTGIGSFSVLGKGDGGLKDTTRLMEPGDPADLICWQEASLLTKYELDQLTVHAHPNQYERRGVLIPDITGRSQPGSPNALYEREQLVTLVIELFLRTFFLLDHKPGLILPSRHNAQVIQPESPEGLLMSKLNKTKLQSLEGNSLKSCLSTLETIRNNLHFAVIVSSFMSPDWEQQLINIGRNLELVVIQIIDPWDLELPNLDAIVNFNQNGQTVRIDTRKKQVRTAYRNHAAEQQNNIRSVIGRANAQHYQIETTKPLIEQMLNIFRSFNILQLQAA